VPRIDFGHFYKFIASTGLVLVVAALVGPWIYSQSTQVLTIPADDLKKLTATARKALAERQEALAGLQSLVFPWASIVLFLLGAFLLTWGLIRWYRRQSVLDSGEDLELVTKQAAFESATPTEVAQKRQQEVAEELQPDEVVAAKIGAANADRLNLELPNQEAVEVPTPTASPTQTSTYSERMAVLRSFEERLVSLLERGYSAAFSVNTNVRLLSRNKTRYIFDALLDPIGDLPWGQLAIDIKAFSSLRMLRHRLIESMVRLALAANSLKPGNVFTGERGRPVATTTKAVLIIVSGDSDALDERLKAATLGIVNDMNTLMRWPVGVIVFSAREFEQVNALELRAMIARVWARDSDENQLLWRV
jgi:hypothetical protein